METAIYCRKHRRRDIDGCEECEKEFPELELTLTLFLDVDSAKATENGEHSIEEGREWVEEEIKRFLKKLPYLSNWPIGVTVAGHDMEWEDGHS